MTSCLRAFADAETSFPFLSLAASQLGVVSSNVISSAKSSLGQVPWLGISNSFSPSFTVLVDHSEHLSGKSLSLKFS